MYFFFAVVITIAVAIAVTRELEQRERQKSNGLSSKTTTLHVHHAFLYISLPSLHDYDGKMPDFTLYGGEWRSDDEFFVLFLNLSAVPKKQLSENSPTFDIFSGLEYTRQRLKKREYLFKVTFSLPSPSSMLKLPKVVGATLIISNLKAAAI